MDRQRLVKILLLYMIYATDYDFLISGSIFKIQRCRSRSHLQILVIVIHKRFEWWENLAEGPVYSRCREELRGVNIGNSSAIEKVYVRRTARQCQRREKRCQDR